MQLKTRTIVVVEDHDWDKLVQQTYGRPYCFQQQDGCQPRGTFELDVPSDYEDYDNDEVAEIINGPEMGVSLKAWLARDPESDGLGKLWWQRNFYPSIGALANDLHSKGLLDAGSYTIIIDW